MFTLCHRTSCTKYKFKRNTFYYYNLWHRIYFRKVSIYLKMNYFYRHSSMIHWAYFLTLRVMKSAISDFKGYTVFPVKLLNRHSCRKRIQIYSFYLTHTIIVSNSNLSIQIYSINYLILLIYLVSVTYRNLKYIVF